MPPKKTTEGSRKKHAPDEKSWMQQDLYWKVEGTGELIPVKRSSAPTGPLAPTKGPSTGKASTTAERSKSSTSDRVSSLQHQRSGGVNIASSSKVAGKAPLTKKSNTPNIAVSSSAARNTRSSSGARAGGRSDVSKTSKQASVSSRPTGGSGASARDGQAAGRGGNGARGSGAGGDPGSPDVPQGGGGDGSDIEVTHRPRLGPPISQPASERSWGELTQPTAFSEPPFFYTRRLRRLIRDRHLLRFDQLYVASRLKLDGGEAGGERKALMLHQGQGGTFGFGDVFRDEKGKAVYIYGEEGPARKSKSLTKHLLYYGADTKFIGTTGCLTCVGVYFEVSGNRCFCAHINAWHKGSARKPSKNTPKLDTNDPEYDEIKEAIISRLMKHSKQYGWKRAKIDMRLTMSQGHSESHVRTMIG